MTLGLGGLVFGLIESPRRGWGDPGVLAGLSLGIAGLSAFLMVETRSKYPMLPLSLFRSPTFSGANALTLFLYGALASVFFFLPLNLIQVQGYSPLEAGAAILPFVLVLFLLFILGMVGLRDAGVTFPEELAPWILGLIRAAQNAHWGWFVLGILFWPVAVAYLLTHLRRPSRPPAAPPPPAFTP